MERLLNHEDLTEEEAEASLNFLLKDGSETLISAFLVLLRAKGVTYEEVCMHTHIHIHTHSYSHT